MKLQAHWEDAMRRPCWVTIKKMLFTVYVLLDVIESSCAVYYGQTLGKSSLSVSLWIMFFSHLQPQWNRKNLIWTFTYFLAKRRWTGMIIRKCNNMSNIIFQFQNYRSSHLQSLLSLCVPKPLSTSNKSLSPHLSLSFISLTKKLILGIKKNIMY